METKIKFLIIIFLCFQCISKRNKGKEEILIAENKYDFGGYYNLKLYSDSTYNFITRDSYFDDEKGKSFEGRYISKGDSIYFSPLRFEYAQAEKAVVKNNFVEFLNGRYPLRIELIKSKIIQNVFTDTSKFKDYTFFIYNSQFYSFFSDNERPCDLDLNEISKIDSLVNLCITRNFEKLSLKPDDYFKQCIAVLNSDNEKVIWVNCLCKKNSIHVNFKYKVAETYDGGDCYFSLKINLTKLKYYELSINGLAYKKLPPTRGHTQLLCCRFANVSAFNYLSCKLIS
jgi:hypothetical protein